VKKWQDVANYSLYNEPVWSSTNKKEETIAFSFSDAVENFEFNIQSN
jgi:hypothetical protein